MKIVSPKEISALEKRAFAEGVHERELMENAGKAVAHYCQNLIEQNGLPPQVLILTGKGNNGGDGFVAGRCLIEEGFTVHAIQLQNHLSPLCLEEKKRFIQAEGVLLSFEEMEDGIHSYGVIIDALFGTGFTGTIEGDLRKVVHLANQSELPILAIDIPSGLNGETGEVAGACIQATVTLALTAPKMGFFLGNGWNCIGKLEVVPIGLPDLYYEEMEPEGYLLEKSHLHPLLPPIVRNRHKFQRGHAVILAGSPGMTGSSYLSSFGAFRGGAGYVHLLVRDGMEEAYHNLPELITPNISSMEIEEVLDLINGADACLVGPGFGRSDPDQKFLKELIPQLQVPTVLDADALYLLSRKEIPLPEQVLLTPHHGEMARLLGQERPAFNKAFIQECQAYAKERGLHLLLKGAPTFYLSPAEEIPIALPFGDPGMATAGAGDLLSGVLAALLAQKLEIPDAALLGASLHGLAGELAAKKVTSYAMKAMDIGECLPEAFKLIGK